jgi:hypothetical protein
VKEERVRKKLEAKEMKRGDKAMTTLVKAAEQESYLVARHQSFARRPCQTNEQQQRRQEAPTRGTGQEVVVVVVKGVVVVVGEASVVVMGVAEVEVVVMVKGEVVVV